MTQRSPQFYLQTIWSFLLAACLAIYYRTLYSPAIYDDRIEVFGNRTIRDLDHMSAILTYNPSRLLLQLSYALNFHRSQFDTFGYHIVNVTIHGLSIGAALWMLYRIALLARHQAPLHLAATVTAIWGLHPMATESVSYITGRSESLCALFCFLSLGCWANKLSSPGQQRLRWGGLGFAAALAAMLSKEVGIVLPGVMLLMEYLLRPTESHSRSIQWRWYMPFAVLICLAFGARFFVVHGELPEEYKQSVAQHLAAFVPRESDRSLGVQLLTQAEAWLRYTGLWLLPIRQTIYHHLQDLQLFSQRGFLVLVGWLGMMIAGWRVTRHNALARFAFISAAIFLLPSSSIAPLKESMAEHRAHQFGFYLLLLLAAFVPKWRGKTTWVAGSLVLVAGLATFVRNQVWENEINIWKEAVDIHPKTGEAWYGLGDAYRFQGRLPDAERAFVMCVELDPDYLDGWVNLGVVRAQMGNAKGAKMAWKEALKRNSKRCDAHNNLGFLAARLQRWQEAKTQFVTSLQSCPDNLLAHYGLGELYYKGPRLERKKAVFHYERVLEIDSTFENAEVVRDTVLKLTW